MREFRTAVRSKELDVGRAEFCKRITVESECAFRKIFAPQTRQRFQDLLGAKILCAAEERARIVQQKHQRDLRVSSGKCVYDFQAKIDWHKGKALDWVLEAASLKSTEVFSVYIGDDITDEDAFRAVKNRGVGIIVREGKRHTDASYALNTTAEVGQFLEEFASGLPGKRW